MELKTVSPPKIPAEDNLENKCPFCKAHQPVSAYCTKCKAYVCTECQIINHRDHEKDIADLTERCTKFLSEVQKLFRMTSLMADRRQIHIKDESLEAILTDIKTKILKAKDKLETDIDISTEEQLKYFQSAPLIQEFNRRRAELVGNSSTPFTKAKAELNDACKELLAKISENKLESADKLISKEKLEKLKAEVQAFQENASGDLYTFFFKQSSSQYLQHLFDSEFIQEIRKLKQTEVKYVYDPLSLSGMIKLSCDLKRPPRIFQFDRANAKINIYDIEQKMLLKSEVNSGFILPFRFVSIEIKGNVYLSGGDNDHGKSLKSLYLYDEIRGALITMADMTVARSKHALVGKEEDSGSIIAIGGETGSEVTNSCEIYEVKNNAWKNIPSLNEARCGHAACYVENKIYVCAGWNKDYLNSFERLDDILTKWEHIRLPKKSGFKELQLPGIFLVSERELMIFGGYKAGEELANECWIFDWKTGGLTKMKQTLPNAETFVSSEARRVGTKIYTFGYEKGGIYIWNIEEQSWEWVPQEKLKTGK